VPGLTDGEESLRALMGALTERGARQGAASYLFLRWGIRMANDLARDGWSMREMRRLYTHKVTNYCGGGTIWLPSAEYRRAGFARLKEIAQETGFGVRLCRCKNPDIVSECCHPQP